jgi:hypothetical protein
MQLELKHVLLSEELSMQTYDVTQIFEPPPTCSSFPQKITPPLHSKAFGDPKKIFFLLFIISLIKINTNWS